MRSAEYNFGVSISKVGCMLVKLGKGEGGRTDVTEDGHEDELNEDVLVQFPHDQLLIHEDFGLLVHWWVQEAACQHLGSRPNPRFPTRLPASLSLLALPDDDPLKSGCLPLRGRARRAAEEPCVVAHRLNIPACWVQEVEF